MKAILVKHQKVTDEWGNTIEIRYGSSLHRKKINPMAIVIHSPTSSVVSGSSAMTTEKARETTGTTAGRRKPTISKALTNFLMISLRT
jgi:hypothetical protein